MWEEQKSGPRAAEAIYANKGILLATLSHVLCCDWLQETKFCVTDHGSRPMKALAILTLLYNICFSLSL
jgi:hypothetical protein